jgi:hypothetical protein
LTSSFRIYIPIITAEKQNVKPGTAFEDIAIRGPFEIVQLYIGQ